MTDDNVVSFINRGVVNTKLEPDQNIVEQLKKMLAQAEAGHMQAIFAVGWLTDNSIMSGWQGGRPCGLYLAWRSSPMSERVRPEGVSEEVLTVFMCGPNRECEHAMDHYIDLTDEDGRVCGMTLACSKCGETEFNLSMWND